MVLNLVLGPLVIWSYVRELPGAMADGTSLDDLWAGIGGWTRRLTNVSIALAAIAYLVVLWHLRNDRSLLVLLGYALFLGGAVLWAPLLRRGWPRTTVLVLTLTSIGAAVLLRRVLVPEQTASSSSSSSPQPLVVGAATYVLFHVFALDNLHWGIRHLQRTATMRL